MLTEIYVDVDDFCKAKRPLIQHALRYCGTYKKLHPSRLTLSEVMTILVYYHLSPYENFKPYYTRHVCTDLKRDFPDLVSYDRLVYDRLVYDRLVYDRLVYDRLVYDRLVALVPRTLIPLVLADRCARSLPTGIYYIDSTPVKACHVKRAHQHQTLKGFANWGKSSVGWFFGLKIDLLINHLGQLVQVRISSGSTADSNPKVLFDLTNDLAGWVFGDKGYLLNVDQLELVQHQQQLHFVAKPRKAIKKPYLPKALFA